MRGIRYNDCIQFVTQFLETIIKGCVQNKNK